MLSRLTGGEESFLDFMPSDPLHDRIFCERKAADYLGLSDRFLRQWRSEGVGPTYIRLGKRVGYQLSDLKAFIDANRVRPVEGASRG